MRKRPENKSIDPSQQVVVKRADRVRMVQMDAEKS